MSIEGTLIHKETGKRIEGVTKTGETPQFSLVSLAAGAAPNQFYRDQWDFKPGRNPLPTEDGVVILNPQYFPVIRTYQAWFQFEYNGGSHKVAEAKALERLSYEGARIFDAKGNELNKEDYL